MDKGNVCKVNLCKFLCRPNLNDEACVIKQVMSLRFL